MLPRPSQRSIFHLGEGVDDHRRSGGSSADEHVKNTDDTTRILGGRRDHGRQRRNRDAAAVDAVGVGLQILVQSRHHTRAPPHSHIVLKQVVVLPTTVARHRRGPGGSFLSACSRCRRKLSSSKDVYMYRGDQGFCSEECRCQQILADEATEREAMIKKEKERMRRGLIHHLHHGPRSVMAAIDGASRRRVAIAY